MGLKQTLTNVGDEVLSGEGGVVPDNFIITTPAGLMVWSAGCGEVVPDVLVFYELEPGESFEHFRRWEQVDNRGEPVSAGTYVVYGTYSGDWGEGRVVLITEPLELQVIK